MLTRSAWFWWGLVLSVLSAANILLSWPLLALLTIVEGLAIGHSLRRRFGAESRQQWGAGLVLFVYAPLCLLAAWDFVTGLNPALYLAQLHLRCVVTLIVMCLNVPNDLLSRKKATQGES